jgi:hypothetical protein
MHHSFRVFAVAILIAPAIAIAAGPNFGPKGMADLTPAQKTFLDKGGVVFATTEGSQKGALIEATILFDKTPQQTWELLTRTENQPKYLDECDKIEIIKRTKTGSRETHTVKVGFIKIVYGVLFQFHASEMYFHWWLDPDRENDLAGLEGFWKLYPYGEGKTLARYGSYVSIRNIPSWLESTFKERGVKKSLVAVRKYINSGGAYKK